MKSHRVQLMLVTGLGLLLFTQCPDSRQSSPVRARPVPVAAVPVTAASPEPIAQEIIALRDACLRALSLRDHALSESEIAGCRQYGEKAADSRAAQNDRYHRLISLLLRARGLGELHTHAGAR